MYIGGVEVVRRTSGVSIYTHTHTDIHYRTRVIEHLQVSCPPSQTLAKSRCDQSDLGPNPAPRPMSASDTARPLKPAC